ncbi:hypothetical protein [Levilactobacillus spicheri]
MKLTRRRLLRWGGLGLWLVALVGFPLGLEIPWWGRGVILLALGLLSVFCWRVRGAWQDRNHPYLELLILLFPLSIWDLPTALTGAWQWLWWATGILPFWLLIYAAYFLVDRWQNRSRA